MRLLKKVCNNREKFWKKSRFLIDSLWEIDFFGAALFLEVLIGKKEEKAENSWSV